MLLPRRRLPGRRPGWLGTYWYQPQSPVGWSCCGQENFRAKGCCTASCHIECVQTATALAQFPVTNEGKRSGGPAGAAARQQLKDAILEQHLVRTPKPRPVPAGCHVVALGETSQSIAMRYGLTHVELLRSNELLTPSLYPGQRLVVKSTAALKH